MRALAIGGPAFLIREVFHSLITKKSPISTCLLSIFLIGLLDAQTSFDMRTLLSLI